MSFWVARGAFIAKCTYGGVGDGVTGIGVVVVVVMMMVVEYNLVVPKGLV